jgi:Histidine kinase/Histidine kinase-, DNA gyrase B-, and HSP90-like ATPase
MKPFAWHFWIRFSLVAGLGPALGFGFGVSGSSKSFWMGLFAGIAAGVVFVAVVAVWYRWAMRRRDPAFNFAAYNFQSEATFELPVSAADAFDLCLEALKQLPGFYQTQSEPAAGLIRGLTGGGNAGFWSSGTPGEKLSVVITPVGESASSAYIRSQPAAFFIVLDFGKNKHNISSISNCINSALQRRYDEAAAAAERAEMQRALTAAKLSALQAQIEPHFLYNTLANAQSLTRTNAPSADAMLGHLITFLRLSLPANGDIHGDKNSSLGQEIERVAAYLEIMKIRMGNRLRYQIEMDKALRHHRFAPLMLQTLVENAIKHGIEPKIGGGMIMISAHKDGDQLCVEVTDDGRGLSTATSGSGIGLKNIREQLQLAYVNASLSLQPNPNEGMKATIRIPMEH